MYLDYFGLKELPFSIAPDPRYLFMSERHREALAHLLYGVSGQGGFVLLTGEVGTGKTTTCRCFLDQIPSNTDVAFIVNPKLSARELMASICDELHIEYPASASIKKLNDLINSYLLNAHSVGRHTVLIIDEAQNLRVDVLEQLRLLTNLETSEKKLLQVVLLGQPELREVLAKTELRQLAQRITARYHLKELTKDEVHAYVKARLAIAGRRAGLFSDRSLNKLFRLSKGVPRLINLIADRALLGAYATQSEQVKPEHIAKAYREIVGEKVKVERKKSARRMPSFAVGLLVLAIALILNDFIFPTEQRQSLFSGYFSFLDEPEGIKVSEASVESKKEAPEPAAATIKPLPVIETVDQKRVVESEREGSSEQGDLSRANTLALKAVEVPELIVKTPSVDAAALNGNESGGVFDLFNNAKEDRMGRYFAFQAVFERWSESYPQEPFTLACDHASSIGLGCLHKQGNWRSVKKLNRPAVLTLVTPGGESFFVALLSLQNDVANIYYQQQKHQVRLKDIDEYWLGEYSILWRLPSYERESGAESGIQRRWVSEKLEQLDQLIQPENEPSEGELIEPLEARIKRFQRRLGLEPDGIAGTLTLIELNSLLDKSVPKLVDQT